MRILIVEDEERLAESLKKSLEKEGFAADYVTDGPKAEERLVSYQNEYDLAIVDWMLPGKSGLEVCKAVRSKNIKIPILMLTARFDVADKVVALESGADDYVVKPFSLEELIARIKALARRPSETIPVKLELNGLSLNENTRHVLLNNKTVHLTTKEFSILQYLMERPDQVVRREQILDHLWGFDFSSFSNVIDVHMKNLRRKIKNDKYRFIETVRGVGYRMRSR